MLVLTWGCDKIFKHCDVFEIFSDSYHRFPQNRLRTVGCQVIFTIVTEFPKAGRGRMEGRFRYSEMAVTWNDPGLR